MNRTHKSLEVVICTQVDYLMPTGKAYIVGAERLVIAGVGRLLELNEANSFGVLFVNNHFTADQYPTTEMAKAYPPHCLRADLSEYEPVGVQNVFSQRLLVTRGLPVFHLHKSRQDMWSGSQPNGNDDADTSPATVHTNRGGASTAYSLNQFLGSVIDKEGVSSVNVWGVDTEYAVKAAVAGFLRRGYRVRLLLPLCEAVTTLSLVLDQYSREFSMPLHTEQLNIVSA